MNIRNRIKGLANAVLPTKVMNSLLFAWRVFYWKRRKSINPRKNRAIVNAVLTSGRPIKLELGSAKRHGMEDWIASDINGGGDIKLDLTELIPFPDSTVDRIYTSHVLEHFSYPNPMLDLLRECHRILKPGGTLSLAVPNARIFLDAYAQGRGLDRARFCTWDVGLSYKSKIDYVNFVAYNGGDHKHMFDEENLLIVLGEAGFRDVVIRPFDPEIDLEIRQHESIYAQAVR